MVAFRCRHHGKRESSLSDLAWLFCGCTGSVHLACQRVIPPVGTPRPPDWPGFLSWRTRMAEGDGQDQADES